MRKWLAVLAVLAALWISFPAQAQTEVKFDSAVVELWPEFDKPEMLVMYQLVLSSSTTLPLDLDFRVPASATIQAVAVGQTQATITDQGIVYESRKDGDWTVITIKNVTAPAIRIEYYDRLEIQGTGRHYVYQWPGDNATAALTIIFQQPVGATDLVTDPVLTNSGIDQVGLVYYQSAPQSFVAGQSFTLTADYQKATDALSNTGLPVQPTQPLDASTPGRVTMSSVLPWVLAGIGGALIVVGIVSGLYMWKKSPRRSPASRKRHSQPQQAGETDATYCHQCGKRAQPGDVFCRTCGMRLRKED